MSLPHEAQQALAQGIAALPFTVSAAQQDQLAHYLVLLNQWNGVHNLTAVREVREQVTRHLLDCLAVMPALPEQARCVVDVGSGAGLPAVIIAIMHKDMTVFALEASKKKAAFMRHCAAQLALPNLHAIAQRVEKWQTQAAVDVIISRAMSSVDDLLRLSVHLGNAHTQWMIMKGREQESLTLPGFRLIAEEVIDVPLLAAKRRLLKVVRDE